MAIYGRQAWFLFVIENEETNIGDQKFLEQALYQDHKIKSCRYTLKDICLKARVNEQGILFINEKEIGIVYYRSGYAEN
jgi:hypothetical protein